MFHVEHKRTFCIFVLDKGQQSNLIKQHNEKIMKPSQELLNLYELGKEHRNSGLSITDLVYSNRLPRTILYGPDLSVNECNFFYMSGYEGHPLPEWVKGYRYGKIPAGGQSYNYRDDYREAGVSMAEIIKADGEKIDTVDYLSLLLCSSNREKVAVEGWLHYKTGGDGEPIIVLHAEDNGEITCSKAA